MKEVEIVDNIIKFYQWCTHTPKDCTDMHDDWLYCVNSYRDVVLELEFRGLMRIKINRTYRNGHCPYLVKLTDKGIKFAEEELALKALAK
jgi:hypothetical protein